MNYVMLDEEGFPTRPCSDPDSDYMCKYLQYDNLFYEPYCNNNCVCQYLPRRWRSGSTGNHRTNKNN